MYLRTIFLISVSFVAVGAEKGRPAEVGGVLKRLTFASFGGSTQTSVSAMATAADGSVVVAGNTDSAAFPTVNAAQAKLGESQIVRSDDAGRTWKRVGSPADRLQALAADAKHPEVLYGAGATGLFKTVDGGSNWTVIYAGKMTDGDVVVDPGNPQRIAALMADGSLIRSEDGGKSFSPFPSRLGSRLLVDPNGSGTLLVLGTGALFLSRDWGVTFRTINTGVSISSAAFVPGRTGWIYAANWIGAGGSLVLSMDFGISWISKSSSSAPTFPIFGISVDPEHPDTILAATQSGVYLTTNGMASWMGLPAFQSGAAAWDRYIGSFVGSQCGGGLMFLKRPGYSLGVTQDFGATWERDSLSAVSSVVRGAGCTVWAVRGATTDAFVAKLERDGGFRWSTFLGGVDAEKVMGVATDRDGGVVVVGTTSSPDFPTTAPMIGSPGPSNVFVVRYRSDGRVDYAVLIGSGLQIAAHGPVDVDRQGQVYLAGTVNGGGLAATPGAINSATPRGFVMKLSARAELSALAYVPVNANSVAVDAAGEPVVGLNGAFDDAGNGILAHTVELLDAGLSRVLQQRLVAADGDYLTVKSTEDGAVIVSGVMRSVLGIPISGGGYVQPAIASACIGERLPWHYSRAAYVAKVRLSDFAVVYSTWFRGPCSMDAGAPAVDPQGRVAVPVFSGQNLPLWRPALAGNTCLINSGAVIVLSADGSKLDFGTYLDTCVLPVAALGVDGSLIASTTDQPGGPTGVLRFPPGRSTGPMLHGVMNQFSGDASAVAPGGLYRLSASGYSSRQADLGLTPSRDLPLELEHVRVTFDGVPAAIRAVAPDHVDVAAPFQYPASRVPFHYVEMTVDGEQSNGFWIPAVYSRPGLMPYVQNQDGSMNDEAHPAKAGSTIAVFATGMGATSPVVAAGSIAHTATILPVTPVYSGWTRYEPATGNVVVPAKVQSMPGFLSSIFRVDVTLPTSVSGLIFTGLILYPQALVYGPPVTNSVAVYVTP